MKRPVTGTPAASAAAAARPHTRAQVASVAQRLALSRSQRTQTAASLHALRRSRCGRRLTPSYAAWTALHRHVLSRPERLAALRDGPDVSASLPLFRTRLRALGCCPNKLYWSRKVRARQRLAEDWWAWYGQLLAPTAPLTLRYTELAGVEVWAKSGFRLTHAAVRAALPCLTVTLSAEAYALLEARGHNSLFTHRRVLYGAASLLNTEPRRNHLRFAAVGSGPVRLMVQDRWLGHTFAADTQLLVAYNKHH
jgi:hypothetical protein